MFYSEKTFNGASYTRKMHYGNRLRLTAELFPNYGADRVLGRREQGPMVKDGNLLLHEIANGL